MNKVFCSSCGYKNLYEINQPKFCSGCGAGIGGGVSRSNLSDIKKGVGLDVEIEKEEKFGSINLDKLRGQIEVEANSDKIKLGDIMGSSSIDDSEFSREASKLPDGKALLDQTEKECSSTRKPTELDA
jgi:hypothetical protein